MAAVVHQSTTTYEQTTLAASKTVSVVVGAGSNRKLVVTVALEVDSRTVSGITFNGTENFVNESITSYTPGAGPVFRIEVWSLDAPTVTTANVVISIAGGTAIFSGGITYATEAGVVGTKVSSGAATANPSVTVTDFTSGDLLIDILQEANGAASVGANQTLLYDNTGLTNYFTHGSRQAGSDGGIMSWTQAAAERHLVAFAIKQVAGGATATLWARGMI